MASIFEDTEESPTLKRRVQGRKFVVDVSLLIDTELRLWEINRLLA